NYYGSWNTDGDRLVSGGNVNGGFTFKNNWEAGGGFNINAATIDDRVTRGGPAVLNNGFNFIWSWLGTDGRKPLRLNMVNGAGPSNPNYALRYVPYSYNLVANGNPDFNVKSFRTTNVLRSEYKPGSTLFIVCQQARENDAVPGNFRFGRDMHDVFGVAPTNVF